MSKYMAILALSLGVTACSLERLNKTTEGTAAGKAPTEEVAATGTAPQTQASQLKAFEPEASIQALEVEEGGSLLAASERGSLTRIKSDGSAKDLGERFDGKILSVAPLPDGRVLVGGGFPGGIARLTADGARDTGFETGKGFDAPVNTLAVDPLGGILVGGDFTTYDGQSVLRLARLQPNGALDTGYGHPIEDALEITPEPQLAEAPQAPAAPETAPGLQPTDPNREPAEEKAKKDNKKEDKKEKKDTKRKGGST